MQNTDLTPFENEIIKEKYSAKFFSLHTESEQNLLATSLMLKISFITGWVMPVGEMLQIGIEELTKKINEDYASLNVNEITFAFRKYGTIVEDWGKTFNLNLFDKVLPKYLSDRSEASDLEFRLKSKTIEQKVYSKEELDNEARGRAMDFYNRLLVGKITDVPTDVANILMQDFKLELNELSDFIVKYVNSGVGFYEKM